MNNFPKLLKNFIVHSMAYCDFGINYNMSPMSPVKKLSVLAYNDNIFYEASNHDFPLGKNAHGIYINFFSE